MQPAFLRCGPHLLGMPQVYSQEELKAVAAVVREHPSLIVMADEVGVSWKQLFHPACPQPPSEVTL